MKDDLYLAIDIGASSGKAICGVLNHNGIKIQEVFRFPNEPVYINGSLRWNILTLWKYVLQSISECSKLDLGNIKSIGIDTWGVDFIFLDKNGQLVYNPYCYRDSLTEFAESRIREKIKDEDLFRITGLQINRVTSLSQMVSLRERSPWIFDVAKTFLMIPDFFRHCLCNQSECELTIAGSSQLLDINTGRWSEEVFKLFSLPLEIMPDIVRTGAISGKINKEISKLFNLNDINIVATAGHDTSSAAVSIPIVDSKTLFISLGTWAVFGFINDLPYLGIEIFKAGFINEPGFNCTLIVRNMSGLYLFENLYRQISKENKSISYRDIIDSASASKKFQSFVDPNDRVFFSVEDVISAFRVYCDKTGQKAIGNVSEIFRVLLEGIALSFRRALLELEQCTNRKFERICIVGGGVWNHLLCQMIANATGLKTITGPAEATALGNICIQALAEGQIRDLNEIRNIIASSFEMKVYEPEDTDEWEIQYNRFFHLYK
ncbi:MAG: FGGY family carbohydrate kinase [bacterium]|nr:FGGY family carbohydrate kinase [bacterium]